MRKKRFVCLFAAALCALSAAAFAACADDSGGSGGNTNGGSNGNPGGEQTVTKEYTVSFDSAGGTAVQSVTVKEGSTLKAPETPVKATLSVRYEFTGWYYEGRQWSFETDVVSENITLTAEWELAEEYTKVYPPKS